jgi:hypothetical protein
MSTGFGLDFKIAAGWSKPPGCPEGDMKKVLLQEEGSTTTLKGISNNAEQIGLRMKICQIKAQIARNSGLLRRFATQSWRILASRRLLMSC